MPRQSTYFAKLFGVSSFLHVVVIFGIVCLWHKPQHNAHQLIINRRISPASIVLLPLVKTVPGSLVALSQQQKKTPKSVAQPKVKPVQPKKVVQPKKEGPPKQTKSTALVKKEQPKPKASPAKKQSPVKKPAPKPVVKKTAPTPKVVPIQPTHKATADKQKKEAVAPQDLASTTTNPEIIYVGRDDLVLLNNHRVMQENIERAWKPPVGLSKDLMCTVAVAVNSNGTIESLSVEESSKVLSYDVTARMALSKVAFPKMFWGKKMVITFKQ